MEKMLERTILLRELVLLSRPEWSSIFSGCVLVLGVLYPAQDIILGVVSLFLFSCGHFSLSALADAESDRLNPRSSAWTLRNPYINSKHLNPKTVLAWVGFLWTIVVILNFLYLPGVNFLDLDNFNTTKFMISIICFVFALGGSYFYSMPPFRLKGKPIIDLLTLMVCIGIFMPIYVAILNPVFPAIDRLIAGILLSSNLIFGIYFVLILADLDIDKQAKDITTAVMLGWDRGSILASILIIIRATGVLLLYIYWTLSNLILLTPISLVLIIIEYLIAFNLFFKRDRPAATFTWKTMVVTSIIHSVFFMVILYL